MKYQSFKDFLAELDACQAKVRDVTFCDIIKIVTVDNETVKIDLSSGELKVETTILGSIQPKSLRLHYAAHPAEFNSMLDELKKTCDQVAEAAEGILEALTSHAVPAKMIEAMKGENVDADPKVIIKELTCARVHELATEAARGLRLGSIIMTTEIEILSLIVQLITLILLFIASVAGIKYILSNWKINRFAKKIEKFAKKKIDRKLFDEIVQKLGNKAGFRKTAKNLIEGTDTNLVKIVDKIDDLGYRLDNINDTLKMFENYKEREYPTDISQNASKKD